MVRGNILRQLAIAIFATTLPTLLIAQPAPADNDGNCGIVYGTNRGSEHAFSVCAPKGWQLDNSILAEEGIHAVFYPTTSSFERARDNSFMYVNTVSKQEVASVERAIKN